MLDLTSNRGLQGNVKSLESIASKPISSVGRTLVSQPPSKQATAFSDFTMSSLEAYPVMAATGRSALDDVVVPGTPCNRNISEGPSAGLKAHNSKRAPAKSSTRNIGRNMHPCGQCSDRKVKVYIILLLSLLLPAQLVLSASSLSDASPLSVRSVTQMDGSSARLTFLGMRERLFTLAVSPRFAIIRSHLLPQFADNSAQRQRRKTKSSSYKVDPSSQASFHTFVVGAVEARGP